jgi:hypothetical protein
VTPRTALAGTAALATLLFCAACGAPVRVTRLSPIQQQRLLAQTALTGNTPSERSQIVLRRHHLAQTYADQPELALATLHAVVLRRGAHPAGLFALAELSYLYARRTGSRPHALAASLYAYAFLFPGDPEQRPPPLDARRQWATDLYAAGLVDALRGPDGRAIAPRSGAYPLPFGTLTLAFDESQTPWSGRMLTDLVPTVQYAVHGLHNRYRRDGIGVPLAARPAATGAVGGDDLVADVVRVPATAVLRLERPREQLAGGDVHARLDIFPVDLHDTIEIDGTAQPLATDRSAALAITLTEAAFWRQELSNFLGNALGTRAPARLLAREPYQPGRIPVVLVHGTRSSVGRWANMVNDLESDARIRARYQFWFFTYDSGNPIPFSAMLLRRALRDAVARFDPTGRDPALHQMVVIGHSQGGLLAKMTVIESGSAFWDNVSSVPIDEAGLPDHSRRLVDEVLFVTPLPFVSRVIFIATPHRGTDLASGALARRLAARLISMPRELVEAATDVLRDPAVHAVKMQRLPTAIDNMSPSHPFIVTLSGLPVAPGVAVHSIIPVRGFGPLEEETDGVVTYRSAHIEPVESERVIRGSSHSTQNDPRTIDEVRRILLQHAAVASAPSAASASAP